MVGVRSLRILAIDDEGSIRFAMDQFFQAKGHRIDCARELEEAEALLECNRYDVVITDLRLTGVPGTEGLQIVSHSRLRRPDARVVILTGFGSIAMERETRARGADLVLSKPVALMELESRILQLVAPTDRPV